MNKKDMKKLSVRELIDQYQVNCDRINEIAETCEKEKRERNEKEEEEFVTLVRENQLLQMKMHAATAEHLRENPNADRNPDQRLRELVLEQKREATIVLCRDLMTTEGLADTGIIPVSEEKCFNRFEPD